MFNKNKNNTREKINSKVKTLSVLLSIVISIFCMMFFINTNKAYADDYWVGQTFSGSVYIGNVWHGYPSPGYMQSYFPLSGWSGELSELGTVTGTCADHTAADPYPQWATYSARVTSVDKQGGWVNLYIYITPYDPTDGVTSNAAGLIGYQHIELNASLKRNFTGDLELWKQTASPNITNGNVNYSIQGAQYGLYASVSDAQNDFNRLNTFITNADGWAGVYGISPGTYYVREIVPSPNYKTDGTIYPATVVSGTMSQVNGCSAGNPLREVPNTGYYPEAYKVDNDTGGGAQGDSEFNRAQFSVNFYSCDSGSQGTNSPVASWVFETDENGVIRFDNEHKISGPDLYYNENGEIALPLGSLSIQEILEPEGYNKNSEIKSINITGNVETVVINESVKRGGFEIQKWDAETNKTVPQGDADYSGVTIDVINKSEHAVFVDGQTCEPEQVCYSFQLNADGSYKSADDLLPYGEYELKEVSGSENGSYLVNSSWSKTINIDSDRQVIQIISQDEAPNNQVARGGFEIQKYDEGLARREAQGDASYAGIHITVTNRSANSVKVNNTEYAPGDICFEFDLPESGYYKSAGDLLPYGTYEFNETSGSDDGAYLVNNEWSQIKKIDSNKCLISLIDVNEGPNNKILTGGFKIQKWDEETSKTRQQGDGDYEGVHITVTNKSAKSVKVNGECYEPNEICYEFDLPANGYYETADDLLPYGTYELRETSGSDNQSYLVNNEWSQTITIRPNTTFWDLTSSAKGPNDQIARGGFEIQKWDAELDRTEPQGDGDYEGVHITVTNRSANPVKVGNVEYDPGTVCFEFDLPADGHYISADDLLPYGTYEFNETSGSDDGSYIVNEDWSQIKKIDENGCVIDLTDVDTGPNNNILRGGFKIQKWDNEIGKVTPQGDSDYAGVHITVTNKSATSVHVNGQNYDPDEICFEFDLPANGYYETADDLLPYGTYEINETSGSDNESYLVNSEWTRTIKITPDNVYWDLTPIDEGPNDQVARGSFDIQKWDAELDRTEPQGDGSYAGVHIQVINRSKNLVNVEGVEYQPGEVCFEFDLPDNGSYSSESKLLPYGTYEFRETEGSDNGSYYADSAWTQTIQIRHDDENISLSAQDKGPNDQILRGGFEIQKWDAELQRVGPQGDGNYAGVHIVVYNRSLHSVNVDGNVYAPGDICFEFDLQSNGYYKSDDDLLPYGTYEFRETEGSDNGSYYANTEWTQTIQVREQSEIISLISQDKGPNDQVLRGGIAIQKFASEVSDGTLNKSQNGEFNEINLSSTLLIDGVSDAIKNAEEKTVDNTVENSDSFINNVITASEEGSESTSLTTDDFGMKNDESQVTASDSMATAQAGAMFKGAEITIYNASEHSVNIDGRGVVQRGGIVAVLVLDENGYASTDARALPYGTYTLKETKAPEGYHLNTEWEKTVQIREEAKIYEVGDLPEDRTEFSGVDDQVMRGDYKFIKNASDTQSTMPLTPFLLVNLESGENHVIVTNENGEFNSASYVNGQPYNLHSNNTNANDEAITWYSDGSYSIDVNKLDIFAGVWFTGYGPLNDPNGVLASRVEPNDNLGALPYGDYAIIELNADSNNLYFNISSEFTISRDNILVNNGTLTDEQVEVEIHTTALEQESNEHIVNTDNKETVTLVDTVSFGPGLRAGWEYQFVGTLMDKRTNESIKSEDGTEITATTIKQMTAEDEEKGGTVEVIFENVPVDLLRGKTTVVFEDCLTDKGVWVASHANIEDDNQTIYFPSIHTTATDNTTQSHEGNASSNDTVIINDIVEYSSLKPNEQYKITGTLIDKETGEPIEGIEPVTVEFTPEQSNGDVTVSFEVPSELIKGKTTVVFEDCYYNDKLIATHADIDDEGQTVSYPSIHTAATDGNDGDQIFSGQSTVTLVDTVTYENLQPGIEYTMVGNIYNKQTGDKVDSIETVTQKFTPESSDGTIDIVFTFDVTQLVGYNLVVFEDCYNDLNSNGELEDNEIVATHSDINDEGQTVYVNDAGLADDLISIIQDTPLSQTGEYSVMFLIFELIAVMTITCIPLAIIIVRRKSN